MLPINEASHSGHLLEALKNVYANTRSSETSDVHEKMRGVALRFQMKVWPWRNASNAIPSRPSSMKWSAGRLGSSKVIPMSSGVQHPGTTFEVRWVWEYLWKKCRAENIVGGALTESASPQKVVCLGTCPFETTTFPAQA